MGLVESNKLTFDERKLWKTIRERIKANLDNMWVLAEDLKITRDSRLYREEFATFDDYVTSEIGWHKDYANKLIAACEVRQDLNTMVFKVPEAATITTERQMRELANVAEDKLEDVVEKAAEIARRSGTPITAKVLREARKEVAPDPPKQAQPEREPGDEPPELADHVAAAQTDCRSIMAKIQVVLRDLEAVDNLPGLEVLFARKRRIKEHLENAVAEVRVAMPDSVCPRCDGEGCPQCGNHGWVNLELRKSLEKSEKCRT